MAQIVDTSDFRPGLKIKWEGGMWVILECSHHKMGRGGAIVRGKLRNLETGSSVDQSFKSGERFERIIFDEKPAQYQYKDGEDFVFMDMESYDQVTLSPDVLGDMVKFLIDDLEVSFDMYEGRVMGIELPNQVTMKITDGLRRRQARDDRDWPCSYCSVPCGKRRRNRRRHEDGRVFRASEEVTGHWFLPAFA